MRRNIHKYYWFQGLVWTQYYLPILVVFYQSKGMSFAQIMLLQTIYYFARALAETPTGIVADRMSRKLALICGVLIGGPAVLVIPLVAPNFPALVVDYIIRGIAAALVSGADSAWLYDLLKSHHREEDYQKIEGTAQSITQLGFMVGNVVGGLLTMVHLQLPFIGAAITYFAAAAVIATVDEPDFKTEAKQQGQWESSYWRHGLKSIKFVAMHREIRWVILHGAVVFVGTKIGFWILQPFLRQMGVAIAYFGVLFATFSLTSALFARYAAPIQKRLGELQTLVLLPLLLAISFIMMGLGKHLWPIMMIYLQQISSGMLMPVNKTCLNRNRDLSSAMRGTVLSITSQISNLAFAMFAPFLGLLVDALSLSTSLVYIGVGMLVVTVLLFSRYPLRVPGRAVSERFL